MLAEILAEAPRFFSYYNVLFLGQAVATTFALSAAGSLAGLVFGFLLALVRRTAHPALAPARWIAVLFVEIFRRVPFLITLLLTFFVFQLGFGKSPLFVVALVAGCLIASAYTAEIVRAGFDSVHRNQWDAAAVMNMTLWQSIRYVALPQAWRVILPPAFSYFVLFIKDTALASHIGVIELTYVGKVLNNKGFSAVLVFGTVLVLYFALSYPLMRFGTFMEKRLAPSRNR